MRIISPVLLTFALAVSGTLITPPISAHAAESLVATHDNENAKMELYLVSGDPTKAGQTVEYRVKLTNLTANPASFESINYNLDNAAGCKWRNAAPNEVQECYIANHPKDTKLTHQVTEAEAEAGGFVPFITFRMYSQIEYQGETTTLGGINEDKAPTTLTVTNPKADGQKWRLGERIEFKTTLTNNTGKARGISAKNSNLTNWEGCKWSQMPVGKEHECNTAYHVVTVEDVQAGYFVPEIVWQYYPNPGYNGEPTYYLTANTAALPIAGSYLEIKKFALSPESEKEHYQAGDVVNFAVELAPGGDDAMSLEVVTDANLTNLKDIAAKSCAKADLQVGTVHQCQLSYVITEADLARGELEAKLAINGKIGDELAHQLTASTYVYAPKEYPDVTSGTKAADADPSAPAAISEVQTLASSSNEGAIRIPAIAVAPNGDLLASYDYRPRNGLTGGGDSPNENSIMQMRSTDNGKTWQAETVVARGLVKDNVSESRGYSDPSYVVDHETGTVYNFHVYSQVSGVFANNPAYTYTADDKIDEANPHTMNLGLSVSTDNGYTWTQRVITDQVLGDKGKELTSCFATSGAGTQKMAEPNKGRLLQQMACVHKTNGIVAFTIYSDDHGATWKSGNATPGVVDGKKFDENKVAELSDGSLILISRAQNSGGRIICNSTDSGENWTNCRISNELSDEANNAQVIRAFPNATPGTLRSKVLLFSGTPGAGRNNGKIWASFDDGKTWPLSKQFRQGGTGYTTMAMQSDGTIGLLMEPGVWNHVAYLNFNLRWLEDDFRTELKGTETEQTGKIGEEISPISLGDLFERNDPELADTFQVDGLPAGLVFAPETGEITGTPVGKLDAEHEYAVTVTLTEAEDGTGRPRTATSQLTLKIAPRDADNPAPNPVITPIDDQKIKMGAAIAPITPQVKDGVVGEVTGLPEGVTYDSQTGTISGTPTRVGRYTVTLTILNVDGEEKGQSTFTIEVEAVGSGEPEKPVDPTEPTQPQNPEGKSPEQSKVVEQKKAKLANTGATALPELLAFLTITTVGGVLLVSRQRRAN